jgi:hypothetical protein
MALNREAIYAALFDELQTLAVAANPGATYLLPKVAKPPFGFADRRYKIFGQLAKSQYPAMFMQEIGEHYERELMFGPATVTLVAHVVVQSYVGEDPAAIPAQEANNLADAIEDCIETGAGQFLRGHSRLKVNLDGSDSLVLVARVSGRQVMYNASQNGRYTEATMEIELFLPGL